MPLVIRDRVKETTTTAGTGTITLAGAVSGFQSFSAIGNGNSTYYVIADPATGDWEVGIGTYTASGTTLSRTTVLSSSNSGSLVPFAGGSKDVFVSYPSSRAVYQNEAGTQTVQSAFDAITATSIALTTGTITTPPTNNTDIVNKQYADAIATGIHFHEAVAYATTAALPASTYNNGTGGVNATLTGNVNGALTVDGYTFTSPADNGTRILIKNQANGAENGVYTLSQAGNLSPGAPFIITRATDFDSVGTGVDQIDEGDFFLVTSGTANVNTAWVQQTPPPIIIGTTAIVFQQFSAPITYTAGTGLSESPTYTFNIANIGTAGTYGSASSVPVITTNAQGQVTGVTPTAIAINGSAVTGNITGQAGSVANALTAGSFLTSGGTYNGSAARTFAVDATDANTASKVVARDASGNFAAGTITAALSGNATSATNVAGGAANRIVFNTGSGATSFVVAPTASGQVLRWNGSSFDYAAGTISGVALGSNLNTLTFGTFLTGTSYNGTSAVTIATNATSANTVSTLVARDASGNFSAGTVTAALSGNATTATTAGTITNQANSATITATSANTANQIVLRDGSGNFSAGTITATLNGNASTATSATTSGSTSGNAATATALQTARNIGGVSFNGTANIDLPGVNTTGNQNTSGNAATATTTTNWGTYGGVPAAGTSFANPNTIGRSDANGYAYFNYINSNTANSENPTVSQVIVTTGGDNFYRKASIAHLTSSLSGTAPINISGNAATATTATSANNIDGIAFKNSNVSSPFTVDTEGVNGIGYSNGYNLFGYTDGGVYCSTYSVDWQHQINGDFRTGQIAIRGKNSGTWQSWRTVLDSGNYTSFAPSLTGSGASGTWSINVTGSAGSATSATTATTATTANALNTGNNYQVNSLGVGTAASGTAGEIRATNNVTAFFSSDIKFKENVRDIPNAAATATYIGGKLFDWTDAYIAEHGGVDGYFVQKNDFGVVAQDVLKAFPIAVRTRPDGSLAVDYEKLSALALAAIAEQEVRIAKLEALVAKLIEG